MHGQCPCLQAVSSIVGHLLMYTGIDFLLGYWCFLGLWHLMQRYKLALCQPERSSQRLLLAWRADV